jgi:RHS repeat-associated protein
VHPDLLAVICSSSNVKQHFLNLVSNRTKLVETKEGQSPVTTMSTYNARDQLLTETTGSTTINYGYDSNGSLIIQTGRTQSWDLRGRFSGATVDGKSTSYRYTPDGIRSSVTEGSTTIDYIIDGMTPSGYQQVVEERDGSGLLVVRYTYGASLDPISEMRGGTSSLYLGDGHSGVRQAIDLLGAVVLAQRFDAFGVSLRRDGLATPIGYRGERFDATLGQYYLRARYYDPRSGRFTGVDPFAGNMGDPLQLMRYGYAGNSPIWGMDPTGMEFSLSGLGARIASGLGIVIRTGVAVSRVGLRVLFPFRSIRNLSWAKRYDRLNRYLAYGTQTLSSSLQLLTLGSALGWIDKGISAYVGIPIDGSDLSGHSPIYNKNGNKLLPEEDDEALSQANGQWILVFGDN